jgi:hypothetical protein
LRQGNDILRHAHPDAIPTMKHWINILKARWDEVDSWAAQRGAKLSGALDELRANAALLDQLMGWLTAAEANLRAQSQQPLPDNLPIIEQLFQDHQNFEADIQSRQPDVERLTKTSKHVAELPVSPASPRSKRQSLRKGRMDGKKTPEPVFKNARIGNLFTKWRQVWLMAMERRRKLQDALDRLNEIERMKHFDFDEWRQRYMRWMNHNKSRIMDFFRKQDRDHDGRITRQEFIDGILQSKFPTTSMEMQAVADKFDRDGDGFIDYKDFVAALRPERADHRPLKPMTEAQRIHHEIKRQEEMCTCQRQFRINKIGEGKYCFGDSQKLRLVRILRSTVMVRVGGGWMALDEFLVKNDPCRVIFGNEAKGRTNLELREQFHLAEGVSQSMTGFKSRTPGRPTPAGGSQTGSPTTGSSVCSSSTASGPVMKTPKQFIHPDNEVKQIMTTRSPLSAIPQGRLRGSTGHIHEAGSPCSPVASRGSSRPSSRASVSSDVSEHSDTAPHSPVPRSPAAQVPGRLSAPTAGRSQAEVQTSGRADTRSAGGRTTTTVTYQTHMAQTRTLTTPTAARVAAAPAAASPSTTRLPKPSTPTYVGRKTPTAASAVPTTKTPTASTTSPATTPSSVPSRPKKPQPGGTATK